MEMFPVHEFWQSQAAQVFPLRLSLGQKYVRVDALTLLMHCEIFRDCVEVLKPENPIPITCDVDIATLWAAVGTWYGVPLDDLTPERCQGLIALADYLCCVALAELVVDQAINSRVMAMRDVWTILSAKPALRAVLRRVFKMLFDGSRAVDIGAGKPDPFGDWEALRTLPFQKVLDQWTGLTTPQVLDFLLC